MTLRDVRTLLNAAAASVEAAAIVVGAATAEAVEFVCRGRIADERVDPQTVFYGASVTKQIIGTMLARAIAAGTADPNDLVLRWLPELPDWMMAVQLRHLIHHTSDLPDVTDPVLGIPRSNSEVIERFQQLRPSPNPQPGAHYDYNNAGYVLLAEAITRMLHQPISDVASTQLFGPLGLTSTRLGGEPTHLPEVPDPPGTIGDGGLWTSIADLTTWLQACNRATFGAETQRLAETTGRLTDGSDLSYAWGMRIRPIAAGRMITHGGSWRTWLAKTARVPDRQIAVAVLSVGGTEQAISDVGVDIATALAAQ